jgi:DNA end-binding protein Ku
MLSPEGEPLARKYYSEKTEKDLDADEMVRGYEVDKGKFVTVTDEELERLAPEKTRDIDLTRFVKADSIPPIYFERGYYLTPDANSDKAYKLLAEAMEKSALAGLATFVMRGKEYPVAIFSDHGILRAETMRFPDALRSPKDLELPNKPKVPAATVKKFETLIAKKSKKSFSGDKLKDTQSEKLLSLVKKKQAKKSNIVEVETEPEQEKAEVIDLVQVLKRSLQGKGKSR